MDTNSCHYAWSFVEEGVPDDVNTIEGAAGYPVRRALMQALTQHNPVVCLEEDDVEALATLYPDCSAHSISSPVCYKHRHRLGLLRVMLYVLCPALGALLFIVVFEAIMHRYARLQLRLARKSVERNRQRLSHAAKLQKMGVRTQRMLIRWVKRHPSRYGTTGLDAEESVARGSPSFVTSSRSLGTARTSVATPPESSGKPLRTWEISQEHVEEGPTARSTTTGTSRAASAPRSAASLDRV